MGYNLTIGEAVIEVNDEYVRIAAEFAESDDAPTHCHFTKNGNSRSPSYTAWSEFCKAAEIYELFYGEGWSREERRYIPKQDFYRETVLLGEHPGAAVIIPADLTYIRDARIKRELINGGREPGFWDDDGVDNGKDHVLARLLWLEFWFDWALKNCENPVIQNT
jgi:hypothetical protein